MHDLSKELSNYFSAFYHRVKGATDIDFYN